jgi:transposase
MSKMPQWLADLLRHGLRHPRALSLRHPSERSVIWCAIERVWCKNERVASESCPRSVLETANVKVSSVATDVLGKSGRDMLQAIIEGTTDAEVLANLARGLLRKKLPQLQEALDGRVQTHHRILLKHIARSCGVLRAGIGAAATRD